MKAIETELQINLFSHRMSYQHIFQGSVAWVTFQSGICQPALHPLHTTLESLGWEVIYEMHQLSLWFHLLSSLSCPSYDHMLICAHMRTAYEALGGRAKEIFNKLHSSFSQSLGSDHRNSYLWRTHSLATGRSLYSLNLVIKGEKGRAKQGGRLNSECYRRENIPAGVNYKAELFPSSHVISTFVLPKALLWALWTLPALSSHAGSLFLSARPFTQIRRFQSFAPALSSLLFPTGHNLQSPELLLKMILKHLCVQSFCRSSTGPGLLHLHILSLLSGCFPSVVSPNFLLILIFTPTQWSACLCSPSYFLYLNFLHLGLISNELPSQKFFCKGFHMEKTSKTEK